MKSGLHFLLAAKCCEIGELQQLTLTAELVDASARLVHELQRERGMSNLYLGSAGQRFGAERLAQVAQTAHAEHALRQHFDQLDTQATQLRQGARLFARIAYVLHGLAALPALRQQVARGAWLPAQATAAYTRLIAGLLAVIFEAADTASDPAISRLLVGFFNFMQSKELAGQERATGSALFASGHADDAGQQRLAYLIESQERALEVFAQFAPGEAVALWQRSDDPNTRAALERMRRMLCATVAGGALNPELSQRWFDTCTERMEAMKAVEDHLSKDLRAVCHQRREHLVQELQALDQVPTSVLPAGLDFFDATPDGSPSPGLPLGTQLQHSVLELVQAQAQRLQAMSAELDTTRASLNERKLVERAKGLLMAQRQLSEAQAHKTLRQLAMNQNRRLVDVAEAVLALADLTTGTVHPRTDAATHK
ncbi:nitrate- and nitrite sensing domain-containing protein [Hydrogenophaga atypica]|uniref:Nitrate- and nitrite sensing domain-containing protein n=1 Tax=Hydrogenophaga atypica TaxID=249409 RepID=A0ABW2QLM6_9BURK